MIFNVEFIFFILVLIRISGIFFFSPFFINSAISARVRVGFSFFVAFLVFNVIPKNYKFLENIDFIMFTILIFKELIIGLLIGYFMALVFSVIQIAAEISSTSMGFMMANTFDPMTQSQTAVLGQMNNLFLLGIFFAYGIHRKIIYYLVETFNYAKVGQLYYNIDNIAKFFIENFAYYFMVSVQMALPIVGVLLLIDFTLGILSRIAPQMNVFFVGMPLKLIVAFIVLIQFAPYFVNFSILIFEKGLLRLYELVRISVN